MKTLDEVIESITTQSGLEIRNVQKPERDRFWVDRDTYNDALHYLKEYRSEKAMWEADRKGYLNWIEQYKEAREKHQQAVIELKKNPPLTWDELKTMEGKPVWVEEYDPIDDNIGWHKCKWYLVNFVNDEFFYVCDNDGDENHFCLAEIGKTWTAYRKERE